MRIKEIIGWKDIETLCIPIESIKQGVFKIEHYTEYTCDNCGCIWRIKR